MDYVYSCLKTTNTKLRLTLESPQIGDSVVSGYFSDSDNEIVIGINNSWIDVLVHEFCHYTQWIEDCSTWTNLDVPGGNACDLMWKWLGHEIELKEKEIKSIFKQVQRMELDCERRTVKLIKKYKLPIDLKTYIQEANIYIYFYNFSARYRMWFPAEVGPNSYPELAKMMPDNMNGRRDIMSEEIYTMLGSKIFCKRHF